MSTDAGKKLEENASLTSARKVKVKVKSLSRAPRRARLFATPWTVACTKLLCPWDFQGKSTGVGCHFLLQGIFPTQGSNPGLSHCRQMLYPLSHQGSKWFKSFGIRDWRSALRATRYLVLMNTSKPGFLFYTVGKIPNTQGEMSSVLKPNVWHLIATYYKHLLCFWPPVLRRDGFSVKADLRIM